MKPVEYDAVAKPVQPFGGALDLGHTRQESEDTARFVAQGEADRGGNRILDPRLRRAADMAQRQRVHPPSALHNGRVPHQTGEARAVQRRRHRQQSQIGPQPALGIEREREAEIAVEAAFMDLVEQHRRYAV